MGEAAAWPGRHWRRDDAGVAFWDKRLGGRHHALRHFIHPLQRQFVEENLLVFSDEERHSCISCGFPELVPWRASVGCAADASLVALPVIGHGAELQQAPLVAAVPVQTHFRAGGILLGCGGTESDVESVALFLQFRNEVAQVSVGEVRIVVFGSHRDNHAAFFHQAGPVGFVLDLQRLRPFCDGLGKRGLAPRQGVHGGMGDELLVRVIQGQSEIHSAFTLAAERCGYLVCAVWLDFDVVRAKQNPARSLCGKAFHAIRAIADDFRP